MTAFLDAVWPAVTPRSLLHACSPTRPRSRPRPSGLLTAEEQAPLRWARPATDRPERRKWTAADAVLIDEAAGLIERPPSFGHVVVDEAQDLSPMQCRAIARRSEHGSITLLGDLAQGTAPWAATDWRDRWPTSASRTRAVVPLTVGFRVPGRGARVRQPAAAGAGRRRAGGRVAASRRRAATSGP